MYGVGNIIWGVAFNGVSISGGGEYLVGREGFVLGTREGKGRFEYGTRFYWEF